MEKESGMKIISFSLWGNNQKYLEGALRNISLAALYYPDWFCCFYVDDNSVPAETKEKLIRFQGMVRPMHEGIPFMFNRFLIADDPRVERFISRDTDSRLSQREADACKEWIESDLICWKIGRA